MNQTREYKATWLELLGHRLFPAKWIDLPADALDGDGLIIRTIVELSMADRLRLLVTGRCQFETKTATQHQIGRTKTNEVFSVLPPRCMSLPRPPPLKGSIREILNG